MGAVVGMVLNATRPGQPNGHPTSPLLVQLKIFDGAPGALRVPSRSEQLLPGLEPLMTPPVFTTGPGVGVGVAMTVVVEGAAAGGEGSDPDHPAGCQPGPGWPIRRHSLPDLCIGWLSLFLLDCGLPGCERQTNTRNITRPAPLRMSKRRMSNNSVGRSRGPGITAHTRSVSSSCPHHWDDTEAVPIGL